MKRVGNLYEQIISKENLELADKKARKGKAKQQGVIIHDKNREENIDKLHEMLKIRTYRTSAYQKFLIYEPKEREIYKLPYFPDRILHHAVMNVMKPIFVSCFTADTYSCIEKRGIHAAQKAVQKALRDKEGTQYCLKLDIKKFYPNIDHEILKGLLRRKVKDQDLLWLMDEIVDSADGVPIGNYLSQYFANFYLTYFDHWLKEQKGVKYYFRYADDIVILAESKEYLHSILADIRIYLYSELKLEIKKNCQVFPVESRGIDFVGYVFYHGYTRLRKSIKKRFARSISKRRNRKSIAAYYGWAKHANTVNLLNKLLHDNKKIQRFRNSSRRTTHEWGQNKGRQNIKQGSTNN